MGIDLNVRCKNNDHICARIANAQRAAHALNAGSTGCNLYSCTTKLELYDSMIRPILTYGLETLELNRTEIKRLATCDGNIIKRVLGLSTRLKTSPLLWPGGMERLESKCKRLRLGFVRRIVDNEFIKDLFVNEKIDSELLMLLSATADHSAPTITRENCVEIAESAIAKLDEEKKRDCNSEIAVEVAKLIEKSWCSRELFKIRRDKLKTLLTPF